MITEEVGNTYGLLTVINKAGNDKYGQVLWNCVCTCGNKAVVLGGNLRKNHTRSCGCLHRNSGVKTHNKSKVPEYNVWLCIKQRCYNKKNPAYSDYGGRGITVDVTWAKSFPSFLNDIGERPSTQHTIERRDNNKGYSKDNCYWATKTEQANNTRTNVVLTYNNRKLTASQWSNICGIKPHTIRYRVHNGWSDEETLTTPIGSKR